MMSTHIMDGNLLYSKSTDLNVNLIFKNTFTETSVIMFDRISGYCDQAILMEKKKKNHNTHMIRLSGKSRLLQNWLKRKGTGLEFLL